jgi:branched-chain amino acid transport system substrate-binding protein
MRKLILGLMLLTVVLAGCASRPKGEVIVYVAAPLSGFQANGGQTVLGGAKLAGEHINRAGGLLGYTIRIVPMDDESDSDVALGVAEEIKAAVARGDSVVGVIGHYNSGQTLAAMEIYKDLPIVVITPTASETSITQRGYENFFRVNANDAIQARVDAEFLVQNLGASRIAILYNDTEYGVGLAQELLREIEQLGAEVVLTAQVAEGQERYQEEVLQVQQANPDALFYAGYEIEAPYLRAALVRAGMTMPMVASDGAFLAATIDESDGTAEGMYVSAFAPSPLTVVDEQWIMEYQAVDFRNPDTYSINGYSALVVLAAGAERAESLDSRDIASALRNNTVDSLIGRLSYDDKGDIVDPTVYIFQVRNNAFVQVSPR